MLGDVGRVAQQVLGVEPGAREVLAVEGDAEQAAPRVLIGSDARRGDILQRLMPGTYWKIMKRGLERAMK